MKHLANLLAFLAIIAAVAVPALIAVGSWNGDSRFVGVIFAFILGAFIIGLLAVHAAKLAADEHMRSEAAALRAELNAAAEKEKAERIARANSGQIAANVQIAPKAGIWPIRDGEAQP